MQTDPDWPCNISKPYVFCSDGRNRYYKRRMYRPEIYSFYELRGKGGAGAVTVSECMVHPKTDGSHAYHLDTSILNSLASATYTADAIRRHGAIPSIELSHSGMYAGTYMTDKSRQKSMNQWGPSDTVRPDGVEVKALTKELIDEIVASYKETASLAKGQALR